MASKWKNGAEISVRDQILMAKDYDAAVTVYRAAGGWGGGGVSSGTKRKWDRALDFRLGKRDRP